MWNKLANLILKNRFLILGIITLITVYFGYHAATGLKMENKYGIVLPKDSPTTQNYNEFKEKFGEDGGTLVLGVQTDSLYTKEKFLKWKELGDSILQFNGVESVVSEATLFTIQNNKEESTFIKGLIWKIQRLSNRPRVKNSFKWSCQEWSKTKVSPQH